MAKSARREQNRDESRATCGNSLNLKGLIRTRRTADGQIAEEWARREPQVTSAWCGQSVREAKELDLWVGRVRDSREHALRTDARLAAALREARQLGEELRLGRADLSRLRSEAEEASKERSHWEDQLEVARSCILKLERRLVALRRSANAAGDCAAIGASVGGVECGDFERAEAELEDLLQQRDRLTRELATLASLQQEHDREVLILTRALRASPSSLAANRGGSSAARDGVDVAGLLEQDLRVATCEAEVMRLQLEAADLRVGELRGGRNNREAELASVRNEAEVAANRLKELENEAEEFRVCCGEVNERAAAASAEERAAGEQEAAMALQCEEEQRTLHEEEAQSMEIERAIGDLETKLANAQRRAVIVSQENEARLAEIQACGDELRSQLEERSLQRRREAARKAELAEERERLEGEVQALACELEAGEAAAAGLEESYVAASRSAAARDQEVRAEEAESRALLMEAAAGERREETLRAELEEERLRAFEASRVANALVERRRAVALEADEAMRLCGGALDDSAAASKAAEARGRQLAQTERSCELMRTTLGQRLAAVHEQVADAEAARAVAAEELREEREEHRWLRTQLLEENARRRARLSQAPLALRG
eukprot:TRINITY_DN53942_c0_g1_i1.p1 TRINITY_DN53942_c0_g1~~TRINITY_DN53942_c0_g1_i1.p1  ORF type:complete len:614 (-),score=161.96 TRINITY_DN53942_c0_g1_i1:557-2398(-)